MAPKIFVNLEIIPFLPVDIGHYWWWLRAFQETILKIAANNLTRCSGVFRPKGQSPTVQRNMSVVCMCTRNKGGPTLVGTNQRGNSVYTIAKYDFRDLSCGCSAKRCSKISKMTHFKGQWWPECSGWNDTNMLVWMFHSCPLYLLNIWTLS